MSPRQLSSSTGEITMQFYHYGIFANFLVAATRQLSNNVGHICFVVIGWHATDLS